MKKGGKAVFTCPPEMAYGNKTVGFIPGGSTVKFEVTLINFVNPVEFQITKHNEGEGPRITPRSTVKANIKSYFYDGTIFKDTEHHEFVLSVGKTIRCWDLGFIKLSKGQRATFACPPDLAYGQTGAFNMIGPNTSVWFDVEVVDFTPPSGL